MRINDIRKAAATARIAHAGQKYGESDYFTRHIMDVVDRILNDKKSINAHIVIGYLHDTVEDTSVSLSDLADLGFPDYVTEAVDAISRREGENYLGDYIPRVKENALAAHVKYHDLRSNTNTSTPESLARRNLEAMRILND